MLNYTSINEEMKRRFGEKVYRVSINAGFTCPNRDGTVGYGGCIFCSEGGSGDFAPSAEVDISGQLAAGKSMIRRKAKNCNKFIAYFQAFTNTYGPVDYLRKVYTEAINDPEVVALSIATRPDCLGLKYNKFCEKPRKANEDADKNVENADYIEDIYTKKADKEGDCIEGTMSNCSSEIVDLLVELNQIKPVWVELGLQTKHEATAKLINRGYSLEVYDRAVKALVSQGIEVITHVILGLPGETEADMLETVDYVCKSGAKGIKLQLLHVLKNTKLAELYEKEPFHIMSMEEYVDLIRKCLEIIPDDIIVHRITGDGPKSLLIEPKWSGDKKRVLNAINRSLQL